MNLDQLKSELKQHIIRELNLDGLEPGDIQNDLPLFGSGPGLCLDSIDALELVVIMDNYYGIKISDESVGRDVLYSIDTMAEYIAKNRTDI